MTATEPSMRFAQIIDSLKGPNTLSAPVLNTLSCAQLSTLIAAVGLGLLLGNLISILLISVLLAVVLVIITGCGPP